MQRTLIIAGGLGLMWSLCGHSAPDPLAEAFGRLPAMYGARLSPDGQFVSYLSTEGVALPVLFVTDEQGKVTPVLASKAGDFDIYWCGWANAERLLCGFYGINRRRSVLYPATRLVAVNRDGGNMRVLLQQRQQRRGQFAQFQDDIVDWLPDDPEHVLIEMPENSGTGVSRVNIYDGKAEAVERVRASVREWLSDGHGQPRMRMRMTQAHYVWEYRLPDDNDWQELYESRPGDDEDFYPLGFGEDRDVLLVMKPNLGRLALWEQDLSGEAGDQLVFAHPAVDAGGLLRIGKYRRLAGISYVTDSPQMHYFDAQAERIVGEVSQAKPGMQVSLVDESWDRSIYLMHIASPTDAGRYYRLDRPNRRLQAFWPTYPTLEKLTLGIMRPQPYKARDGVEIPAYLTLPASADARNLPAVLLPHGGPESRDHLAFNFLAQFLAARGYAVLQPNYRGSGGYGDDWVGEGGFKAWRQAISDLTDGTKALIDAGIADPQRICIVGWSYGGYAALLSVVEEPRFYQCAVSIAGVTDPMILIQKARNFMNRRWVKEYVGTDEAVIDEGSPLNRVDEIQVPVLMFHGDRDINVDVEHSKQLNKRLKRRKKDTELIIYEDAEHSLWRSTHRIDMLDRLGAFLDEHTAPSSVTTAGE